MLEELRIYYKPVIESINNVEDMKKYLLEKNDLYTRFILEMIQLQQITLTNKESIQAPLQTKQVHHIFPRSVGGPDDPWNLVSLTFAQHNLAHELRYQAYKEIVDFLFINMRKNQDAEAFKQLTDLGRATQKTRQIGVYDLSRQSARGKIGGAKQTEKKREKYREKLSDQVKYIFSQFVIWSYLDIKNNKAFICRLDPFQISLVRELFVLLDNIVPFQNRTVTNATSGLARVMKGERKTYCNWSLLVFSTVEEVEQHLESISKK